MTLRDFRTVLEGDLQLPAKGLVEYKKIIEQLVDEARAIQLPIRQQF